VTADDKTLVSHSMVQKSKVLLYGGWQLKVIAPDVVFNPTFARI
jgi:hypothetical protein